MRGRRPGCAYRTLTLAAVAGLALCGQQIRAELSAEVDLSASTLVLGGAQEVIAGAGDSLTRIAARFGVGVAALARASGLSPTAKLAVGQRLIVEDPHVVPPITATAPRDGILINVPQRMLFQLRGGAVVARYPIAAGRPTWRTPIGTFEIDARVTDKPWIVPVSIQEEMRREGKPVKKIVPPGPENPLGRHWLGLSASSCGIHGTIAPSSIYSLRTHGCIRLHPDDAAALYASTELGDPVQIVYEPLLLASLAEARRICLEAHPDAYGRSGPAEPWLARCVAANALEGRIDWERAREVMAAREGIAIDVTVGGTGGPCT